MEVSIIVLEESYISFALRVSSEEGFDFLSFYINDQLQDKWSGEIDWRYVSFHIPQGEHRLKWQYEKDDIISDRLDAAWIDDIFIPVFATVMLTEPSIPRDYVLEQNFPNPFNPTTTIQFSIPESEFVQLKIFDVLGREVATLVNEEMPAGRYSVGWNAAGYPSGTYFYRLSAGNYQKILKLVFLK